MDSFKKIKAFYRNLAKSQTVSYGTVEEFVFDEMKYQNAIEDVRSRLKVKLSTGFCSSVLVGQIARHYCGIGERFGDVIEFYHGSTILETIELMEIGKLNGEAFNKSRLIGGLYKEHHSALSQASSISKNILNELSENDLQFTKQQTSSIGSASLLNRIHSDIISKRKQARKITGEWIVFAKVGSINYYLCLATHKEGVGEAEAIYNKIIPTFDEFKEALAGFQQIDLNDY